MGKQKDWSGQKVNRLTFVRPTDKKNGGRVIWELLCDCGKTTFTIPAGVANGHTKSCGCLKSELDLKSWKSLVQQKYGMLTFIRHTSERNGAHVVWELLCDCGTTTFSIAPSIIRGNTKSCGCLYDATRKTCGLKNRKYDPRISSARSVWLRSYKDGCDFESFLVLSQAPCYYCNRLPTRVFNVGGVNKTRTGSADQITHGDFIYNGLDRIDSSKNHSLDNVVTCCHQCNWAKSNSTTDEFLEMIRLVYQNRCVMTSSEEH